ncbi:MAG: prephenate dehydrogenase [Alphaproteobacteria bacterium]|nr:prephenate dehydrogenase [Alphaproteobacteria bacterium]
MQNKRLIIVGGGQAGSSIARGVLAREMYRHVCVVEPDVLSRTDLRGFIFQRVVSHSKRVDFSVVSSLDDALFDRADIVMLATPVAHFEGIVRQIAPRLRPGAVITDVGSSKQKAMENMSGALQAAGRGEDVWVVGGHPGTGRSGQGPMSSDPDMYEGQPVFLVMPDERVLRMGIRMRGRGCAIRPGLRMRMSRCGCLCLRKTGKRFCLRRTGF